MTSSADPPAKATVLVVEDDYRIAAFLIKGLRLHDFEVDWVMTGLEAHERLDEGGHDVLLLDLGLPDIDGLEVLREQRERGLDIPVLVVTARTDPKDRAAAFALGAKDYLTKPLGLATLVAAVRSCLPDGVRPD